MALADTALPYGLRDIKLTAYTDATATTLAAESVDLPYARTLQFTEAEEFQELRGDDTVVTTRGQGATVSWELEAGGISFAAVAVMYGQSIQESATQRRLRKRSTDERPFFKMQGQMISDSGGDVHAVLYKSRCTGEFSGTFGDGEFYLTTASGAALASTIQDDSLGVLYDIFQNDTPTAIVDFEDESAPAGGGGGGGTTP